ncbi:hypothetical protein Stsp02_12750 [Streptomyces sp. NBRC 14336]|uniref:hypothetical protein n=1 Tax=Streptomyces sp. NBRC 14336 TaxID=3030992 RepID=UPI0024A4B28C|nr:hypothetical protein [Streptomyces sp. NBRC 14336]WBO78019.1 hypothetical protein SBE_001589 [Streptomyces sp. SBE_14.2]GLW45613.1 hypothetical protein Stsp02_12750 [Streptomyces sp. NBRC 14336]
MTISRPLATAVASVTLGTCTGVLTNLVTETWTWTLGCALLACVAGLTLVQWRAAVPRTESRRTSLRLEVRDHSRAEDIRTVASDGASVHTEVEGGSAYLDSTDRARDADITRRIEGGSTVRRTDTEAGP